MTTKAIVVRRSAPQIITRYRTRASKAVRRVGRAAGKRAWKKKELIAAPIVGALLGKLHDSIPATVPGIGKNGSAALILTAAAIWTGNDWLSHGAAAALAIASYELTTTGALSGEDDGGL